MPLKVISNPWEQIGPSKAVSHVLSLQTLKSGGVTAPAVELNKANNIKMLAGL